MSAEQWAAQMLARARTYAISNEDSLPLPETDAAGNPNPNYVNGLAMAKQIVAEARAGTAPSRLLAVAVMMAGGDGDRDRLLLLGLLNGLQAEIARGGQ